MEYYTAPQGDTQRQPLQPNNIISGSLPGATEIRIGNNIKISGKNQQILVNTTGGNVVIGATDDGRLSVEATNNDGSKVGIGTIPGTTNLGLYSVDSANHTTSVLGKQADDSNSLKFFDANNIGLAQFGKYPDGTTALKVAKPDIEVGTATNDQLIFNSSQNIFKIAQKDTSLSIPSFTIGTGQTRFKLLTIPHGLSFTPLVDVYVSGTILDASSNIIATSFIRLPVFRSGSSIQYYFQSTTPGTYYPLTILYGVDATNVYVEAYDGGGAFTADTLASIPVTYYLLQETAN